MRKTALLLTLLAIFIPSVTSAQTSYFSNQIDILNVGVVSDSVTAPDMSRPVSWLFGYHFTTVEVGRLNTLGLGVAYTMTDIKSSQHYNHDVAITTSQSVRLGPSRKIVYHHPGEPSFYFNVTYAYNLLRGKHGLYFGFSFGD